MAAFSAAYAEQYCRLTTAPFRPGAPASKQASERGASDRGRTLSERCLETCVMSVLGLYSKFAREICNTTHFDNEGAAHDALTCKKKKKNSRRKNFPYLDNLPAALPAKARDGGDLRPEPRAAVGREIVRRRRTKLAAPHPH